MTPSARERLAVAIGGALGGGGRTALAEHAGAAPGAWPWATFAVNAGGCLLLGVVLGALATPGPGALGRPAVRFLTAGVCGGLTTFSTVQLELVRMLDAGRGPLAAAYLLASLLAGFAALAAGRQAAIRARLGRPPEVGW